MADASHQDDAANPLITEDEGWAGVNPVEEENFLEDDYVAGTDTSQLSIFRLVPSWVMTGSDDLTLTIDGTAFNPDTFISWDSTPLSTTYLDENHLEVVVPADLMEISGVYPVSAINPDPESVSATPVNFTVSSTSPYNGEKLSGQEVVFNWQDEPGALEYTLQLSITDDFSSLLLEVTTGVSEYLQPTLLENGSIYYWRINTWNGTDWSESSSVWTFSSMTPPTAPILVSPSTGAKTNLSSPELTWQGVENAYRYRVQVSRTSDFSSIHEDSLLLPGETTYIPASLEDGRYYWRVCAYDDVDVQGEWSLVWNFKVDTVPPESPVLIKPANTAVLAKIIPKFKVEAVSGAKTYQLQVSSDESFTNILLDRNGLTAVDGVVIYKLTQVEALPFGSFYWRARALDVAGNASTWTTSRSFTVTLLKSPLQGSYTTSRKPTFTWGEVSWATLYRLQVSKTDVFDGDAGDVVLDREFSLVTSFTTGDRLAYGKYHWRLQYQTSEGWSDWTPAYAFTITSTIPMAPALSSPYSGTYIKTSTPSLRWVEAFNLYAPQLRIKNRLINVYLPPDYHESGKAYPVIYLHDGIQMFNADRNNEYRLDETLDSLKKNGYIEGVIAVGVDHSENRWDELSPWINRNMDPWFAWNAASVEGGEGNQYLDFIINVVKPEIDRRYRTLPDRENTAIGGGSMGGIISLYAGLKYPNVFSKVIAFSPVLWFGEVGGAWLSNNQIINYINSTPVPQNVKFFVYIGTAECEGRAINVFDKNNLPVTYPQVLLEGAQVLVRTLKTRGVPETNINFIVNPGGVHQPYMWGEYFDDALLWLYEGQDLPVYIPTVDSPPSTGSTNRQYEIQLSRSSSFTELVQSGMVEENTSFYPDTLLEDGAYYWRVRAINDLGIRGAWSGARSFILDTVPPVVPAVVSPENGALLRTTVPTFSVTSVADARYYHLQVSNQEDFSSILFENSNIGTVTYQIPIAYALPFGTLYWRVRALDWVKNTSEWTETRMMVIDILKSPSDGKVITDPTPTLTWKPAAGATKYHLQISRSTDFIDGSEDVVLDSIVGSSTFSITPAEALDIGQYYWRLQVKTTAGWGNWNPIRAFYLSPEPVSPVLLEPVSGSWVTESSPTLLWGVVTDPIEPVTQYEVQISYSSTFTPLAQSSLVTAADFKPDPLADGKYYWRVRAINELSVKGSWSDVSLMKVDATPPEDPLLYKPLDGVIKVKVPIFSWYAAGGANTYVFEYRLAGEEEWQSAVPMTVLYYKPPITTSNIYEWRVRALDKALNQSVSETRSITINLLTAASP